MRAHWAYLKYVLRHKWFVLLECIKLGVPLWRAIIHDWSKFLPDEWFPYVEWFYTERKSTEWFDLYSKYGVVEIAPWGEFCKDRFDSAWRLHQRRTDHHWNSWVLVHDSGDITCIPMSRVCLLEMIADWNAVTRVSGQPNTRQWYEKNKKNICFLTPPWEKDYFLPVKNMWL